MASLLTTPFLSVLHLGHTGNQSILTAQPGKHPIHRPLGLHFRAYLKSVVNDTISSLRGQVQGVSAKDCMLTLIGVAKIDNIRKLHPVECHLPTLVKNTVIFKDKIVAGRVKCLGYLGNTDVRVQTPLIAIVEYI
jgi:hypothetical protein